MPVVNGTLTDPSGAVLARTQVKLRLYASTSGYAAGVTSSAAILSESAVLTDSSGNWSATLTANSLITPAGSVYQAIYSTQARGSVALTFTVPAGAGPYRVEALLTPVPGSLPEAGSASYTDAVAAAALTAANATYRTVPGGTVPNPTSKVGKSLTRYSHSFGLIPGLMCSAGQDWPTLLLARLQCSGGVVGNATSGAVMSKGAQYMTSNTRVGYGYTPPNDGGLVVIEYAAADYRYSTPSGANLASFSNGLQTMLAYASSQQVVAATASWSAGDATLAGNNWFGGSIHYTSTPSATLTLTVDGTKCAGGVCYLMTPVEDTATNTLTVTLNGSFAGAFNKTGQGANVQDTYGTAVLKVTGIPTTGTSTLVISTSAGGPACIEAVIYPSAAPPTVLVVKDPPFKTSDYATAAVAKPVFDAAIDAVVAGFSNAYSVDLGVGGWWDQDIHLGSDQNHPNDLGMAAVTNRLAQLVKLKVG